MGSEDQACGARDRRGGGKADRLHVISTVIVCLRLECSKRGRLPSPHRGCGAVLRLQRSRRLSSLVAPRASPRAAQDIVKDKSDFVLVSGNVVSNLKLEPILRAHKCDALH